MPHNIRMNVIGHGGEMEPKDLAKIWGEPDNTRLTSKQISIRLPIHVAAKISAICEMYPRRTKTEIIGDLLAAALDRFAEELLNEPFEDVVGGAAHLLARGAGHLREIGEEIFTRNWMGRKIPRSRPRGR